MCPSLGSLVGLLLVLVATGSVSVAIAMMVGRVGE